MKLAFSRISNGTNFNEVSFAVESGKCIVFHDELFVGSKICETISNLRWQLAHGEVYVDGHIVKQLKAPMSLTCSRHMVSKFSWRRLLTVRKFLALEARKYQTGILVDTALTYFELNGIANKRLYALDKIEMATVILARLACCISKLWIIDLFDLPIGEKMRKYIYDMIQVRCMEGGLVILNSQDKIFEDLGEKISVANYKIRSGISYSLKLNKTL